MKTYTGYLFAIIYFFLITSFAAAQSQGKFSIQIDGSPSIYRADNLPNYYSNKNRLKLLEDGIKTYIRLDSVNTVSFVNHESRDTIVFTNKLIDNKRMLLKELPSERVKIFEKNNYRFFLKLMIVSSFSFLLDSLIGDDLGLAIGIPLGIVLVEPLINTSTIYMEYDDKLIKLKSKEGQSILKLIYDDQLDSLQSKEKLQLITQPN